MFGVVGDVSKAHRRIKIRRQDWGFQACRLDPGKVWVNTVGTYGIGSAAYWWARAAAAVVVRFPHYFLGPDFLLELLLYVDDFAIIAKSPDQVDAIGFMVFVLSAVGVPFSWKKFRGGTRLVWIGYWMDLRAFLLGISESRAAWLRNWLRGKAQEGTLDVDDLMSVLGRLCFALGPLEYVRPFVAPIYAWAAAVAGQRRMKVPWSVRFLFRYIADQLEGEGRVSRIRPIIKDMGPAFRADAKAEGQSVVIGGWECLGGRPSARSRWFAVELNRRNAPWAFARGEPFRTIAALELFATLTCIVTFGDEWPTAAAGAVTLSGVTDNLGNAFVLARMMTSKFPSLVILTELAAQLRQRELELTLGWVPRDQNEEADALTNGDYKDFDPAGRVKVVLEDLPWIVLPDMMRMSEEIYGIVKETREKGSESAARAGAAGTGAGAARRRPEDKLRVRDPWV